MGLGEGVAFPTMQVSVGPTCMALTGSDMLGFHTAQWAMLSFSSFSPHTRILHAWFVAERVPYTKLCR